ncbi:peptidoglycan-binding protein [Thermodesulfobacteriota bacterium]
MSHIESETPESIELQIKKRPFLEYLYNTMIILSDEATRNPILTLHEITSGPYHVLQIDLIYWCLHELLNSRKITKPVVQDYLKNYILYDPTKYQKGAIEILQEKLTQNGYNIKIDGIFGPNTLRALNAYQKANNLRITLFPDIETVKNLGLSPELFEDKNNYNKIVSLLKIYAEK